MLEKHDIPATFFCIGEDAKHSGQAVIMQEMIARGHEIANHTMNHPKNYGQLSCTEKKREIIESDHILQEVTNRKIYGFRSSSYHVDDTTIEVLKELGYLYDSSKLPTPALPFMTAALRILTGGFGPLKRLGRLRDTWSNQEPYFVMEKHEHSQVESKLLEIPISVIPIVRFPFHSTMAFIFGRWQFRLGVRLVRAFGLPLVYLFHAVDLLPGTNNISIRKHPT
jgi:peptidoglycan/xylan/chitin deacetylase (PgdA/CDA1 family)